jgi:formin-binding protein 1
MQLRSKLEFTKQKNFRFESGLQPPGDLPFEDLSKSDNESSHNSQINNAININNATMKGTIGANKLKKRVGIFNIFSSNKVSLIVNF